MEFSSVQDGIYALRNVNILCSAPAPDSLRKTHKRCLAFETVPMLVLFPMAKKSKRKGRNWKRRTLGSGDQTCSLSYN